MKRTGVLLILVMILASAFTLFSCNKDTTYTVTFLVDGEVYYTTELLEGVTVTMPDEPTKEGFVFTGWRVETGFTYNESEGVSGNVTFVAEWVEDTHTHVFTKQVIKDEYLKSVATCDVLASYYYSCECGERGDESFTYGELDDHTYTSDCDDECDVCESKRTVADHVYTDDCDKICNVAGCGHERVAPHNWANNCDNECDCGETRIVPDHVYDNDCDKICNECDFERTVLDHVYTDDCDKICNVTGCAE